MGVERPVIEFDPLPARPRKASSGRPVLALETPGEGSPGSYVEKAARARESWDRFIEGVQSRKEG